MKCFVTYRKSQRIRLPGDYLKFKSGLPAKRLRALPAFVSFTIIIALLLSAGPMVYSAGTATPLKTDAVGFARAYRAVSDSVAVLAGSPVAYVNGRRINNITPPVNLQGVIYVSGEFINSIYGTNIEDEPVPLASVADMTGKQLYQDAGGLAVLSDKIKISPENVEDVKDLLQPVPEAPKDTVLVETESFSSKGGWSVDQQFMDIMGSPYLLAHGLGVPVEDCETQAELPSAGTYHVWVRTKNWTKPFNVSESPGRFNVIVDNHTLPVEFGTIDSKDWGWQNGGTIEISNAAVNIKLHDLTGFDGRCDAILFTKDGDLVPPDGGMALMSLRQSLISPEVEDAGDYDMVVVGGGLAGCSAAVSAARMGLSVALIQDRPVLGGNASSEVRVQTEGITQLFPYDKLGSVTLEIDSTQRPGNGNSNGLLYQDSRKETAVINEGVKLFLNYRADMAETDGSGHITAVGAVNVKTGKRIRMTGTLFADCTGDGNLGYLAGADYEITTVDTSSTNPMGSSNLWKIGRNGAGIPFPQTDGWAVKFNSTMASKVPSEGNWQWESGYNYNIIGDAEFIRDTNLRAAYGYFSYIKNFDSSKANTSLEWLAYVSGRRESRRLLGDVVVTRDNIKNDYKFDDPAFPATWSIDLHYPVNDFREYIDGISTAFIGWSHQDNAKPNPYWFPYRSLYSRNIDNLFMAGRDISVTHEALGTIRVMRTTGMMGEAVGIAASICKENGALPRDVYETHLDKLIYKLRVGVTNDPSATPVPTPEPGEAIIQKGNNNINYIYESDGNTKVTAGDTEFSALIKIGSNIASSGASGLAFRVQQDGQSYYLYRIWRGDKAFKLQLYKFTNGNAVQIFEKDLPPHITTADITNDYHKLAVNVKGAKMHFLLDDLYIASYTDVSDPYLSGYAGVRNYAAACNYKRVSFTDISDNSGQFFATASGFYDTSDRFVTELPTGTVRAKVLISNTSSADEFTVAAARYDSSGILEGITVKDIEVSPNTSEVHDIDFPCESDSKIKVFAFDSLLILKPISNNIARGF